MKKITVISCLLILVFLVLLIIIRDQPQDLEILFVEELEINTTERIKACVMRRDGKLVLVDVEKKNNENIYLYVLKLYDHYRNSLPASYITPLTGNFEVRKLEKRKTKLEIELELLYLQEDFNTFLTALMWSYQQLGIEEIEVRVGKEVFRREKNTVINPEIETFLALDIKEQVIIHSQDEVMIPVTYYHNQDRIDFLMTKIIARFNTITYRYEILPLSIIIYIDDPQYEISESIINNLALNLESLDYSNIVIIKNNLIIYDN